MVITLLPEIFQMQEIPDNPDLQRMAKRVLSKVAALPYPLQMVRPFLDQLTNLARNHKSWRIRLNVLAVLQSEPNSLSLLSVGNQFAETVEDNSLLLPPDLYA
jgi:hypothetical protein